MKQYKVSIIGTGNIGCFYDSPKSKYKLTHAHAVSESKNFVLSGVYDNNFEKSKLAAEVWKTNQFENFESAIREADIVCICVPELYHLEVYQKIAKASNLSAIIMEKPLAASKGDVLEILEIADQTNIPTFVNYSRRYLDGFIDLHNWIKHKAGRFITGYAYYGKGVVHNASHFVNLFDYLFDGVELNQIGRVFYDYNIADPSVEFTLVAGTGEIHFKVVPCNIVYISDFELCFEFGKVKYDSVLEQIEYYNIQESKQYIGELNYAFAYKKKVSSSDAMIGLYKNIYKYLSNKSDIQCDILSAKRTFDICDEIRG